MQLSFLPPSCPATCTWSLRRVVSKWTGDGVAWSGEGGRDGVERKANVWRGILRREFE